MAATPAAAEMIPATRSLLPRLPSYGDCSGLLDIVDITGSTAVVSGRTTGTGAVATTGGDATDTWAVLPTDPSQSAIWRSVSARSLSEISLALRRYSRKRLIACSHRLFC